MSTRRLPPQRPVLLRWRDLERLRPRLCAALALALRRRVLSASACRCFGRSLRLRFVRRPEAIGHLSLVESKKARRPGSVQRWPARSRGWDQVETTQPRVVLTSQKQCLIKYIFFVAISSGQAVVVVGLLPTITLETMLFDPQPMCFCLEPVQKPRTEPERRGAPPVGARGVENTRCI